MPFPSAMAHVPVLKRLLPGLMRRYYRRRGIETVTRRHDGLILELRTDQLIDRRLLCWGVYEAEQIATLRSLMAAFRPRVMLDIGACWGYYALRLGKQSEFSEIHCFEPDQANLDRLRRHLALNDMQHSVAVHPVALSDRSGYAPMSAPNPGNSGHKYVVDSGEGPRIPLKRLDECLAFDGATLLIKLDVEGHEIAALSGMEELLRRNNGIVQVEAFAETRSTVAALMQNAGYRYHRSIGADHIFLRDPPGGN